MVEKRQTIKVQEAVSVFRILSSKTRIDIICTLMEAEGEDICVYEIAEKIGQSHSATSHQLAKLEFANIVRSKRMGQMMCYELKDNEKTDTLIRIIKEFI